MPGVTAQEHVVSFGMTASGGAQAPRGPRAPGQGQRKRVGHSVPWRGGLCLFSSRLHLLRHLGRPSPAVTLLFLCFFPPSLFFFLSCSLVLIFHTGKISNISLANETGVFPSDWLTFCHVNFKTLVFFFFLLVFTAHKLLKIFFSLIFFPP